MAMIHLSWDPEAYDKLINQIWSVAMTLWKEKAAFIHRCRNKWKSTLQSTESAGEM